jgi:hypothetical protein
MRVHTAGGGEEREKFRYRGLNGIPDEDIIGLW